MGKGHTTIHVCQNILLLLLQYITTKTISKVEDMLHLLQYYPLTENLNNYTICCLKNTSDCNIKKSNSEKNT